ncbi:uncharacterized protein C8A04DRAFT_24447 [Dichotomopilus funicola]|uniref:Uncharacterized protein n=1 Tax=Dichotomopilus funicola TaxID=1934379 RepID=A0AAN6VC70_9PEZI|nr:hypothetical protein C8A04DRAFT_24447 [Dichotomopilus funicola]
MEFIAHLRRLQAEESDSDEESGRILTSSTFPSVRRRCPASKPAPIATVTITSETCGTKAPTIKPSSPTADDKPTPVTNGTNGLKKRARDDDPDTGSPERAAKKVKSSAIPGPMKGGTSASSSAPVLSAPIKHSKPIEQMEYFERRVHDMLTNPLDFDDCVYDSTKPPSRNTVRSFARYRRLQSKSPLPLVMSGALGPTPLAKPAPAAPITKSKGSPGSTLAKKAQRKAHNQKVQKRVEDIRAMEKVKANGTPKAYTNGNTDGKLTDNAVQDNGNGLGRKAKSSGHSMAHKKGKMADVDGAQSKSSGVKKRKEKRWLTNSRGAGGYGGSRPSNSTKKVNKRV